MKGIFLNSGFGDVYNHRCYCARDRSTDYEKLPLTKVVPVREGEVVLTEFGQLRVLGLL